MTIDLDYLRSKGKLSTPEACTAVMWKILHIFAERFKGKPAAELRAFLHSRYRQTHVWSDLNLVLTTYEQLMLPLGGIVQPLKSERLNLSKSQDGLNRQARRFRGFSKRGKARFALEREWDEHSPIPWLKSIYRVQIKHVAKSHHDLYLETSHGRWFGLRTAVHGLSFCGRRILAAQPVTFYKENSQELQTRPIGVPRVVQVPRPSTDVFFGKSPYSLSVSSIIYRTPGVYCASYEEVTKDFVFHVRSLDMKAEVSGRKGKVAALRLKQNLRDHEKQEKQLQAHKRSRHKKRLLRKIAKEMFACPTESNESS